MSKLTNEQTVWIEGLPAGQSENITLRDDEVRCCVKVEVTDGFFFCKTSDVEWFSEQVKARLIRMQQADDLMLL